jgi:hypothetical protein
MVIEPENYTRVVILCTVVAIRIIRVVAFLGGFFYRFGGLGVKLHDGESEQKETARRSRNQISVVVERRGFGKSGGCKTKPHQNHTASQKVSIANSDSTSRLF